MTQPRFGTSLLLASLAATTALLSACPEPKGSAIHARCEKAYERCLRSGGVLGVCDPVDCGPDQVPPCFVCRSQH